VCLPLHAVFRGGLCDGIQAEFVVDPVDGAVHAEHLFIFLEEQFKLAFGRHLNGVQPDAADPVTLLQEARQQGHGRVEAAVEHVLVEVGEARGVEQKADPFPGCILKPDVPAERRCPAPVTAHPVAELPHRPCDLAPHPVGFVGPVGEGVHVGDLLRHVVGVVLHHGAVFAGYRFEQHFTEIGPEQPLETPSGRGRRRAEW
jgi:hypothetical protein